MHEATHAILDLQKATFPRWEHELIAYLAEALCKISGRFRELPDLISQERAAALARHIIADKAGRTFIRLDDYVDTTPFQNLKSEIIKAHPKNGARSFGVMGSDASAARGAAVLGSIAVARTQGDGT